MNCCGRGLCDVDTVIGNASWPAEKLKGYWYKLHRDSQQPRNWDFVWSKMALYELVPVTLLISAQRAAALLLQPQAQWFRNALEKEPYLCYVCKISVLGLLQPGWFMANGWELIAQWQQHDCIINIHFNAKFTSGELHHHIHNTQSLWRPSFYCSCAFFVLSFISMTMQGQKCLTSKQRRYAQKSCCSTQNVSF